MQCISPWIRCLVAAVVLAVSGCATNTITGRSQLMLVSEQQAISGSASAYSSMIGQFSKKNRLETGTARSERVREITNRLIAEAVRFRPDSSSWRWEVQLIDDPKTVNAFCMAGGKMGIYTGFWEKLNATDDEIAAVMGHEIGHALASHTREKMSVGMATGIGATVLAAIVSARSSNPSAFGYARDGFTGAAQLAVTLPNSREAEIEADQIGIELAARAGFDPGAAITLWEKMAKEGSGAPAFLSTHPSPEDRAQRLRTLSARVDPLYRRAKENPPAELPDFVGNANERIAGSVSRAEYAARVAAQPEAMTFVADEFEKFRRGEIVFNCRTECAFGYAYRKGDWKAFHEQRAWRDLAISVIKVGYLNDLSYFMLAEAAKGLGLEDVSKLYYGRAFDAQQAGTTCGGTVNTCEGFEVKPTARAGLEEYR
jgi:Zn-dependent protease with chaperone function